MSSTAKKRKKERSFRFMMAVDQRRSRRVKWECTVWQITHTFLNICVSTLTFDSPGVSGIHPWCWVSVIDFNCALGCSFLGVICRTLLIISKHLQWANEWCKVNITLTLETFFISKNYSNEFQSKTISVRSDAAWRLREHICRANCLLECRLWIHIQHRCKSGYTTLCFFRSFYIYIKKGQYS